ncbi:MAG TPA: rhomboid family intramembrane serine protease [Haliscomenobacter sp.]|uniref:rhomboid family intramembrane serine protease n=1 Tax=Haliscomenobacter sp. TaxID=2717303 RepID=UPI002CCFED70|nr:rhomboid family intramembrane serine protease [Haliscomenobacter sp.]HOY19208.1 rhomboid family intramembrane serine protease [Haliscomenobacter sp.]HPH19922.1 rhomboid family intramembrane serine protease [Haliscomenobacter sp.]
MEQLNFTTALLVLTGLISWQAFNNRDMYLKLMFVPYEMKRKNDYFRFLTHGMVHADVNHLLFNLITLYSFGIGVEFYFQQYFGQQVGIILYLLFYFSGIILSSLPDYYRHQDNPGYRAVGASGGVAAIVFGYIFMNPWDRVFWVVPAGLYGVLYIIYSAYMDRNSNDNIGHNAHLWGSLYGIVFVYSLLQLMRPEVLSGVFQNYIPF